MNQKILRYEIHYIFEGIKGGCAGKSNELLNIIGD
jgi:hypothetical protein